MSKLIKNKTELLKALRKSVELKEKHHIWNTKELAQEININLNGHIKVNQTQIGFIIKLQRSFRIFKNIDSTQQVSYIFTPSFRY